MSSHSPRPITTRQKLSVPKDHIIYSTRLPASSEKDLPGIGDDMEQFLGPDYAGSKVLEVADYSNTGGRGDGHTHSIQHSAVPSSHTERESIAYNFPPVYPEVPTSGSPRAFHPGGSPGRPRTVLGQVTYDYSLTPSSWDSDAAVGTGLTDGPLEVVSVLAQAAATPYEDDNGDWRRIGDWLASPFVFENTLNDGISILDPGSLSWSIGASAPSLTTYAGWVAAKSLFIARRFVTRWRGPIYMRVTQKVRAQ